MSYLTHKTSYSTHIVINLMERLAFNYKNAMDQLNIHSIISNFLHDCSNNGTTQNNNGKLKLYNNAYQKYYYDILHLYNNSSFKKFKDKYKVKRKKQKDNEHRNEDSASSIDEEQEEDRFLDEYIAKNFDLDHNLNDYANNEDEDDDDLFLNINKKKSKKAFKDKSATNKKRNLTQVSSNKKKSQKKRHKSGQLSDDNILEFSDFVKSKKNKNIKKN